MTKIKGTHRRRSHRGLVLGTVAAGGALAAVAVMVLSPSGQASPVVLAGPFYSSPDQQVDGWVKAHPSDSRTAAIRRIAVQPAAVWIGDWSSRADVSRVSTAAAKAGATPVFVFYDIPDRDCGGYSGGGAPSLAAYDAWVKNMAAGLGTRQAAVVLEPDALNSNCGGDGRLASLSRAGASIHAADPKAKVYYDVGHSGWKVDVAKLKKAGVEKNGDGISVNVSNFNTTAAEAAYAKSVLDKLGNKDLKAVIDVSRNGAGPAPGGAWCNPPGRKIGRNPTTATGYAWVEALLWVKLAGESDGSCNGAPAAGTFSPALAYSLAAGAPASPAPAPVTTAPKTSAPAVTVKPTTATPSSCGS
jgi:endoglucanase